MKKMKKLLALLLVCALAFSMTACSLTVDGGNSGGGATNQPSTGGNEVEEAANAIHFDLSTTGNSGTLLGNFCDYFAQQVKELSNGEMIVDVYYSSALGSEAQNLEALTAGTLDMAVIAIEFYSNTIPELGALILPYLYDNYDQVQEVLDGEAGEYASQRLREVASVENLGYYVMMFRNMYLNKAINNVGDMAGLKIRVPESTLYVNTMSMMGAAPTPMAMSEVYTSCETGVISGYENTLDSCLNQSMYEVLDYLNLTRHLNAPTTISMSASVFDKLTAEQQEILHKAGLAASAYGLQTTKDAEADYLAQLTELMTVVETDTASMRGAIDYTNYDFMSGAEAQKLLSLVQEATGK